MPTSEKLTEIRCECGKLLAKGNISNGTVQLKCKCGKLTTVKVSSEKPYQERITGLNTKD